MSVLTDVRSRVTRLAQAEKDRYAWRLGPVLEWRA